MSMIRCQNGWVLDESPSPGSQMVTFSVYPLVAGRENLRKQALYFLFLCFSHSSIMRAPLSLPHYLPKAPSQNIITLEIRVSPYEFAGVGGRPNIQFIAVTSSIHAHISFDLQYLLGPPPPHYTDFMSIQSFPFFLYFFFLPDFHLWWT